MNFDQQKFKRREEGQFSPPLFFVPTGSETGNHSSHALKDKIRRNALLQNRRFWKGVYLCGYIKKFWSNRWTSKNIFEDLSFLDSEKVFWSLRIIFSTRNRFWISIFFQNRRILAILKVYFHGLFVCSILGPGFDDILKTFIDIVLNQNIWLKVKPFLTPKKIWWHVEYSTTIEISMKMMIFTKKVDLSRR